MYSDLQEQLIQKRFHGVSNIKGIDFQIHYALNTALNLLLEENPIEKITLEGIEDIDLKPFQSDNTYIQVKTSINSWHLSDLVQTIINFISLNRTTVSPNQFNLVLNFEPRPAIKNLFSDEIKPFDKEKLFTELLKQKKIKNDNISRKDLINVISNCKLNYINKPDLVEDSKVKIFKYFNIHPNETETFLLSLLYKFIDWSIQRKTITKNDLFDFKIRFKENQERTLEFEAFGKGLIDRVSWVKENHSSDYFEGKKTRTGHIALGLDVKRPKWLKKIDEVFVKTNVCIIREASGQGKSTLAFRYAFDYWNPETTFIIKVVESAEHAEQISNYLKALSELGLAISVLIDDIKKEKQFFSNVIQNLANYRIPFLITSRNDDYHSYGSIGEVSIEFINPHFDRLEAKQIFDKLKKENQIQKSVISSEWAFEKISSSKSLIEFIYLITQGEMLAERLSKQIKLMHLNNESSKIDFLRKSILADVCQTPLNINQLILKDTLNTDYQEIIQSIQNEFINIENGYIKGYHWVRSSQLINILHENFTNPAITAIKTINLIENRDLSTFVGNLHQIPNLDFNGLIEEHDKIEHKDPLRLYISFIEGLFKIGENQFFLNNKEIYDEAYSEFNEGVLLLFNSKFIATKPIDLFDLFGENENFKKAKDLCLKFKTNTRGFDLVKQFVEKNQIKLVYSPENLVLIAQLLDWEYWTKVELVDEYDFKALLLSIHIEKISLEDLGIISLAFYRRFPKSHKVWFDSKLKKILTKLDSELECKVKYAREDISMEYFYLKPNENYNDATMKRLNILVQIFPMTNRFKGTCINSDPFKYSLGHDNSLKDFGKENAIYKQDVEKNVILNDLVESHYRVKTWFEFLSYYFDLRKDLILYSETLCQILNGKPLTFKGKDAPYIHEKILHSYKKLPHDIESIKASFNESNDCLKRFYNFLIHKSNLVQNEYDENAKRLLFKNYNNFFLKLPKMQSFFTDLTNFAPNYFPFHELIEKENKVYNNLKILLVMNISGSENYFDLNTIS
jgi:hypothetical protein